MAGAWVLYAIGVVLAAVFWRALRGRTLEQLFEASRHHHHEVLDVLKRHPAGGTWRQFRGWMGERK